MIRFAKESATHLLILLACLVVVVLMVPLYSSRRHMNDHIRQIVREELRK